MDNCIGSTAVNAGDTTLIEANGHNLEPLIRPDEVIEVMNDTEGKVHLTVNGAFISLLTSLVKLLFLCDVEGAEYKMSRLLTVSITNRFVVWRTLLRVHRGAIADESVERDEPNGLRLLKRILWLIYVPIERGL